MKHDVQQLWSVYLASKATESPDKLVERDLVEHYYPLVKRVATRLHQKITDLTVDELTALGVDGLYDSIRNYDTSRNTKFETYAPSRIRGSMLDALRKADWVPRLVRAKANFLDKKRQAAESKMGRKLSNAEMAEELGLSAEEFEEFQRDASAPAVHNIYDAGTDNSDGDGSFSIEHLEDRGASQPVDGMIREELWNKLLGKNFTPQERQIMWLYYREDYSMKEISEIVKLSESRVSQMHTMILRRLEQKVRRNPAFFSDVFGFIDKFRKAEAV